MDNRPGMLMPAMIGGFVFGTLAGVPFIGCLCCALMAGAGFLAAFLYSKKCSAAGVEFRAGQGALVGLTSAPFYAVAAAFVSSLFRLAMPTSPEDIDRMVEGFEQADLPPETVESITKVVEALSGGGSGFVISLLFSLIVGAIFATLGGLLGGSVFKVAPAPMQPPGAPPPPPPPPSPGV